MKTLITITGASGAGKDTLMNTLLELNGDNVVTDEKLHNLFSSFTLKKKLRLRPLVSHTTRQPRPGETPNKSYHFVSKDEFMTTPMVELVNYADNFYGLSEEEVNSLKDGEYGIFIVEPNGKEAIEKYVSEHEDFRLISIFLGISEDISKKRMLIRGDSAASISKRLTQQAERDEYRAHQAYTLTMYSRTTDDFIMNVLMIVKYICG